MNTNDELVALNIGWLRQALALVEQLDDLQFGTRPQGLAPHRVGSHLRHILEFYECFLDGLAELRIDYDARKRDEPTEASRHAASEKITLLVRSLQESPQLRQDALLQVRMENGDAYLPSFVSRELMALSSHTIHHFALIAVTLKGHGFLAHDDFGMSPSTLRHQAEQAVGATGAA